MPGGIKSLAEATHFGWFGPVGVAAYYYALTTLEDTEVRTCGRDDGWSAVGGREAGWSVRRVGGWCVNGSTVMWCRWRFLASTHHSLQSHAVEAVSLAYSVKPA